jgi:farnesyl-diphosphate farnesyltransferase
VETLAQAGLTPALLAQAVQTPNTDTPYALATLYTQWLDHTQAQLADGMRYALALKPLRLRLASALPALIGARTVALLRQAGPAALNQRVKMPRHEVHALLWRIALGLGSAAVLQREFLRLSGQQQP